MPAKLPQSLIFSLFLHALLFIGIGSLVADSKKTNFAKKAGLSEIRATIRLQEYTPEKKKVIAKRGKKKVKKKKEVKKIKPKKVVSTKGKVTKGQNSLIASYLTKVRSEIVKYKYKSRIAKRLNLKGEVKLSFNIVYPNIIRKLQVVESSTYDSLDSSAVKTVEMAEDIPHMPEALKERIIPVLFSVVYE